MIVLIIFQKKLKVWMLKNINVLQQKHAEVLLIQNFLLKEVKSHTGLKVEIIGSVEEARLSMKSCKFLHIKKFFNQV